MANPLLDSLLKKALPGVENSTEKANEIVRTHVLWALGAGLVPVPLLDVAAVTAVQLDMIQQLAKNYNQDFSAHNTKTILNALAGSTLARAGASLVKIVPVVGPMLGGFSMSVLSGATTYAVGMVFTKHFDEGGTLDNFRAESYKAIYEGYLEDGKRIVNEAQKQKGSETLDAYTRLEKLQKLRERGIITEEEFLAKKAEILKGM
jgi:uncharacterized protein (DUF697 family)